MDVGIWLPVQTSMGKSHHGMCEPFPRPATTCRNLSHRRLYLLDSKLRDRECDCNANDWVVTETRVKEEFAICHIQHQLYWGFDADALGTPVKLRESPAAYGNAWRFRKYEGDIPALPDSMNDSVRKVEEAISQGLEALPKPVQLRLQRNRHTNNLRLSDNRNDVLIQVPRFLGPTLNVASDFALPDQEFTDGGARELLAVLKLLPHQSNSHLAKFEEVSVNNLIHDNSSYYGKLSSKGLIRLMSDHFDSISEEGNTLLVTTDIGTFTLKFSEERTYVRYNSRVRSSSNRAPPHQDFVALKNCATGQYLHGPTTEAVSQDSCAWTEPQMPLITVLTHRDLKLPNCLRFVNRQGYLELEKHLKCSCDVMTAVSWVAERKPHVFEHMPYALKANAVMLNSRFLTQENLTFVMRGIEFMFGVTLSGRDKNPENFTVENKVAFLARTARFWDELFEVYSLTQSRIAIQDRMMAMCDSDPAVVCAQAVFSLLVKANTGVILTRTIAVPDRFLQIILRPNMDFYIAA